MSDTPAPPVAPRDPQLQARLLAAWAARGPDYRPRTHLVGPDGRARHVNRLILEALPYLVQHAHNPVDWHPWGPEALATAAALDRPIFLSVGYATCHWCHVMEEESFDNEVVAAALNAGFVPVKLDREARPDLDHVFITATQVQQGHAGWPNSLFLLPDGRPFHSGTYFPPGQFLALLAAVRRAWERERPQIARVAAELGALIRRHGAPGPAAALDPGAPAAAVAQLGAMANTVDGGYSTTQQFPQEGFTLLALDHWRRTGDAAALALARRTLDAIAAGGLHDHVGGGFHRYTVDRNWRTPHFEKMLYNQGQLARLFVEAWEALGDPAYARAARRCFAYVLRDMVDASGAFCAAEDADSLDPEGRLEEGAFYAWHPDEAAAALAAPPRPAPPRPAAPSLDAETRPEQSTPPTRRSGDAATAMLTASAAEGADTLDADARPEQATPPARLSGDAAAATLAAAPHTAEDADSLDADALPEQAASHPRHPGDAAAATLAAAAPQTAENADGRPEQATPHTWRPFEVAAVVAQLGLDQPPTLEAGAVAHLPPGAPQDWAALDAALERLRQARDARPRPLRDDKVIAGWNGLMIRALADGAAAFGDADLAAAAVRAADAVWDRLWDGAALARLWAGGCAREPGMLEDYAWLALGFSALADATGAAPWHDRAVALAHAAVARFGDAGGRLRMAEADGPLGPIHDAADGATPAGESAALELFARLARRGAPGMAAAAARLLAALAGPLTAAPLLRPDALVAAQILGEGESGSRRALAGGALAVRWARAADRAGALILDLAPGWHLAAEPPEPPRRPEGTASPEPTGPAAPLPPPEATGPADPLPPRDATAPTERLPRLEATGPAAPLPPPDPTAPTERLPRLEATVPADPLPPRDATAPTERLPRLEATGPAGPLPPRDATVPADPLPPPDPTGQTERLPPPEAPRLAEGAALSELTGPAERMALPEVTGGVAAWPPGQPLALGAATPVPAHQGRVVVPVTSCGPVLTLRVQVCSDRLCLAPEVATFLLA